MDVYGLIGNPVRHSLSPPLHEAAYEELELDARYVTFEPPPDGAPEAVRAAGVLGIAGLNVTTPFKESVLRTVAPDPLAARIGAVNTIDFGVDPPAGYNTDATGVLRTLEQHDISIAGSKAVVVGAGGAGRAIAVALDDAGATVAIANRTLAKAEAVATLLDRGSAHGLDELAAVLADAELLIHATTVGLEEDRSPVPPDHLRSDLTVMDAVYQPIETRLLRDAEATGATTIDGGWMLLYQGAEAFERWTGHDAPIDAMNRALRSRLAPDG